MTALISPAAHRKWLAALALTVLLTARVWAGEIHDAAAQGSLDKVKALVTANPKCVQDRDREQKTPLHFAAEKGFLEVVKYLLENQAEVNARSRSGITPMYLAKGFGHQEVVKYLAEKGGSLEVIKAPKPAPVVRPPEPKEGPAPAPVPRPTPAAPVTAVRPGIPVIEAARANGTNALRTILSADPAAVRSVDTNQWTALHHAVEQGHRAAVELLLAAGADANAKAAGAVTALHIAARRNHRDIAGLLLAAKAEVNARTVIQATPLMLAAAEGKLAEMVRLLLKAGADIHAVDKYGNSALVLASALPEPDGVAELLVQAGAAVDAQEKATGFAAIHHAVVHGHRALLEKLLAAKANPNLALTDGETPLSLALFEERKELAELLRRAGAVLPPEPPLDPTGKSLVDHYRAWHARLASGSFEEVRRLTLDMMPTPADIKRVFLKNAKEAGELQDGLRRDETVAWAAANRTAEDRQYLLEMVRNGARPGEYFRATPLPSSAFLAAAKGRQWIANDVPALQLEIKRRGGETTVIGDYYYVGQRWVLMPALVRVFPELVGK